MLLQSEALEVEALVDQLGGIDTISGDPAKVALVAEKLGLGTQLTLRKVQEAIDYSASLADEGVHSLLANPHLRLLWRRCVLVPKVSWS